MKSKAIEEVYKKPSFAGFVIKDYLQSSLESGPWYVKDHKQEDLDLEKEENNKYIGATITALTLKNLDPRKVPSVIVWIVDKEDEKYIVIVSKLKEERLTTLFNLLNVRFPKFESLSSNEIEDVIPHRTEFEKGIAVSQIFMTAYNLRSFMKKLIYYTVYAV